MRTFVVGLTLVAFAGSWGCGGGGETLYPVTGKVAFKDGKPVTGGLIVFDAGEKTGARGEIQQDGSFRLGTHSLTDGVAEGEYRVLVVPPPPDEEAKVRRPAAIHTKYSTPASTPLKLTVSRDRSKNNFKIEVERP